MRCSDRLLSAAALSSLCTGPLLAQSIDKAQMLLEHGLRREAKQELIEVFFAAGKSAETKAKARYLLGAIAIDEGDIGAAHKRWTELVKLSPDSPEAKRVAKRLPDLAQLMPAPSRSAIHDPVARSFLRNGDFWSHGRTKAPDIDDRRIHRVEAAVKWYDKVIKDFPKTPAAEAAAVSKIETLVAWRHVDPTREHIAGDAARFVQTAQVTFSKLKKDHPTSPALQRLRYLIAEHFRLSQLYKDAEEWLLKVIKSAGKDGDFYHDLATRRLEKLKL